VKRPRIVLSDAAVADILEQSDWYQEQLGDKLAKRWGECGNVSCLARCENARRRSTMQVQVDRASWCTTHFACWIPKTFALL
jgi:hypothetical protein